MCLANTTKNSRNNNHLRVTQMRDDENGGLWVYCVRKSQLMVVYSGSFCRTRALQVIEFIRSEITAYEQTHTERLD